MSDFVPLADLTRDPAPPAVGQVALVALGCAKNLVDAEQMLGALRADGYRVCRELEQAEVIIVNTCGFLQAARDEAVREIRQAARQKSVGRCQALLVTGCLAQKDPELVLDKCPEVDAVIGVSEFPRIADIVRDVRRREGWRPVAVSLPDLPYQEYLPRYRATPPWTAYTKIAEGCDCRCTFCAIPAIRGRFRSRPLEAVVAEAEALVADGVRELVLIAEDLTHWGHDRYGRRRLGELLRALGTIVGLDWIRLLYCYPTKVDDELITAMVETPALLPYLDLPLQHAHDDILRAMGRGGRRAGYLELLARLREALPTICLRSTFIVGFPGERAAEFAALEAFLEEARLDRVGFFAFSPEPGTPAAELTGRPPVGVVQSRIARLAERQAAISAERNAAWRGATLDVLIESITPEGGVGRSFRDAPEIDGVVRVRGSVSPGQLVSVRITGAEVHDLLGRVEE